MQTKKKILNIFLVLVILVSTTGVTLNEHYCMGRLKAVAIFEKTTSCGEVMMEDGSPMPCCEDISKELKVEEAHTTSFDFKCHQELFYTTLPPCALSGPRTVEGQIQNVSYNHYFPVLPDRDIPILIQSFLI